MTTAQDQQSRAEFEAAWMKKPGVTKPPARFPNGGDYAYPAANTAWWAWQAARALTAGMEPVAEIVECRVMGQQTVAEVAGSWKFLSVGTKLYTAAQVQAMGRVPPAVKKSYAHDFRPHAEYPWFCADCGYAPHDTLHSQAPRPPAAQEDGDAR